MKRYNFYFEEYSKHHKKEEPNGDWIKYNDVKHIIEQLPKTKDGVIVIPCIDSVYAVIEGKVHEYVVKHFHTNRGWLAVSVSPTDLFASYSHECYSTEEIAKKHIT